MAGTAGSGLGSEPAGFACSCVWARPMAGSTVIRNSNTAQHDVMRHNSFGFPIRAKEGVSLIIRLSTSDAPVSVRSRIHLLHRKAANDRGGMVWLPEAPRSVTFECDIYPDLSLELGSSCSSSSGPVR